MESAQKSLPSQMILTIAMDTSCMRSIMRIFSREKNRWTFVASAIFPVALKHIRLLLVTAISITRLLARARVSAICHLRDLAMCRVLRVTVVDCAVPSSNITSWPRELERPRNNSCNNARKKQHPRRRMQSSGPIRQTNLTGSP